MIRSLRALVFTLVPCAIAAVPCTSQAATPAQTIHGLVGQWNCITSDTDHKTWHTTTTDTMYGPWLQMRSAYRAQNDQPAGSVVKFFGFDSDQQRWIVASFGSSGDFYVIDSKSPNFDGSQWEDVDPADTGTAKVEVQSSNQYTFDARVPSGAGHVYGSHTICRRI